MATIKDSSDWLSCNLFSIVPDVELRETLDRAAAVYNQHPEIERCIRQDQDAAAVEKRKVRDADRRWLLQHTDMLSEQFSEPSLEQMAERPLGVGCPRMPPMLAFVFVVLRGAWGSLTDLNAQERVRDSITLQTFLDAHGLQLPARSTIHENLNVVSEETLQVILAAQLSVAFDEGLDDFSRYFQDSTAVEANSRWPTDSGLLSRVLHRAFHYGSKLDAVGLPAFRSWTMPRWLRRIRSINFEINTTAGKRGSGKAIERLYREQVELAEKLVVKLADEVEWVHQQSELDQMLPSKRAQCETVLAQITRDIEDAQIVVCNIEDRVFEGRKLKSWQRIPSKSDYSAAFICKGDRVPVIGYRPQVVRSGNGLVAHLAVPEGNAADSGQLVDSIDAAVRRTDCAPDEVSVDDGYASAHGLAALRALGVRRVSISGSKGKALTSIEDWESPEYQKARSDRSSVESLMFTLKFTVEFGRLRRRGIDAVRCELLEKVIAYNFARMALLGRRKKQTMRSAA